jgi:glucose-1-phosphate cytidylyltransferase
MQTVILAGGLGSRLSEETTIRPKPMVEIGGKPILWHIMKIYSHFGYNDFIICLGYMGYMIKEYFHHYFLHHSDLTIDFNTNNIDYHTTKAEPWRVTLVDTGNTTMTGGRLKRIQKYLDGGPFMLTYGDGLSDINIGKLIEFHKAQGKLATVTTVQPTGGRFGVLNIADDNRVVSFQEKPSSEDIWINGGFFVLEPGIFKYVTDDLTIWERDPLENLSRDNQLVSYKHSGFWKPMDTLRDKNDLENIWNSGRAEWKLWND